MFDMLDTNVLSLVYGLPMIWFRDQRIRGCCCDLPKFGNCECISSKRDANRGTVMNPRWTGHMVP